MLKLLNIVSNLFNTDFIIIDSILLQVMNINVGLFEKLVCYLARLKQGCIVTINREDQLELFKKYDFKVFYIEKGKIIKYNRLSG